MTQIRFSRDQTSNGALSKHRDEIASIETSTEGMSLSPTFQCSNDMHLWVLKPCPHADNSFGAPSSSSTYYANISLHVGRCAVS